MIKSFLYYSGKIFNFAAEYEQRTKKKKERKEQLKNEKLLKKKQKKEKIKAKLKEKEEEVEDYIDMKPEQIDNENNNTKKETSANKDNDKDNDNDKDDSDDDDSDNNSDDDDGDIDFTGSAFRKMKNNTVDNVSNNQNNEKTMYNNKSHLFPISFRPFFLEGREFFPTYTTLQFLRKEIFVLYQDKQEWSRQETILLRCVYLYVCMYM
jgi:hypothetical protein